MSEPVAWRIIDGEGGYNYRNADDPPDEFAVRWAARYGRTHEPLYLHPLTVTDEMVERAAAVLRRVPPMPGLSMDHLADALRAALEDARC